MWAAMPRAKRRAVFENIHASSTKRALDNSDIPVSVRTSILSPPRSLRPSTAASSVAGRRIRVNRWSDPLVHHRVGRRCRSWKPRCSVRTAERTRAAGCRAGPRMSDGVGSVHPEQAQAVGAVLADVDRTVHRGVGLCLGDAARVGGEVALEHEAAASRPAPCLPRPTAGRTDGRCPGRDPVRRLVPHANLTAGYVG